MKDLFDKIYRDKAPRTSIQLENVIGTFIIGERLHQSLYMNDPHRPFIGLDGELVSWDRTANIIELIDVASSDNQYHQFEEGTPIHGTQSGATANIKQIFNLDSNIDKVSGNDIHDQAFEFEGFGDDIIDFTESNPFGEV